MRVPFIAMLPKLKKRVVKNTILLVHDAENACDPGDKVELAKSRPYSARKHHIVKSILVKDPAAAFLQQNPEYRLTGRDLRQRREQQAVDERLYKQQAAFDVLKEATLLSESQRLTLDHVATAPAAADASSSSSSSSLDSAAANKPKKAATPTPTLSEDNFDDKRSGKGSKANKK